MLLFSTAQDSEPWIPLVRAMCKIHKTYRVEVEDCQVVLRDFTSDSVQHPLNFIVFKI